MLVIAFLVACLLRGRQEREERLENAYEYDPFSKTDIPETELSLAPKMGLSCPR